MQQVTNSLNVSLASGTIRQVFLAKPANGCVGKRCQKHDFCFLEWDKKEAKLGEKDNTGLSLFRYDQQDMTPKTLFCTNLFLYHWLLLS